jgi:methylmalonyl-CoA mutase
MEEAHLGRVDDPAAGSWFLDARTRDLAEAGWAEFQRIEGEGGLISSLRAGSLQGRVAAARAEREAALATGASQLVGVTKFVDPTPRPAPFEADPAPVYPGGGDVCDPLIPIRFAAPFEMQQREAGQ